MATIHFCPACHCYTLHETCQQCKGKTILNKPARFSPQDHYGKYRRALKKLEACE
jgi:H/ACA ribonucleoprotein complex subunit 3